MKKIIEFCQEYRDDEETVLAYEVTIKFIYDQSDYYLEVMVAVLDGLLNKINPIKEFDIRHEENYMKYFKPKLKNIFKRIFKGKNWGTKILAEKCLKSWFSNELISKAFYEEVSKFCVD